MGRVYVIPGNEVKATDIDGSVHMCPGTSKEKRTYPFPIAVTERETKSTCCLNLCLLCHPSHWGNKGKMLYSMVLF